MEQALKKDIHIAFYCVGYDTQIFFQPNILASEKKKEKLLLYCNLCQKKYVKSKYVNESAVKGAVAPL